MGNMNIYEKIYHQLYSLYGAQGWWPLLNTSKRRSPNVNNQRFEICLGAILTQNTNWGNVEKALGNLAEINALNPHDLTKLKENRIKNAIKPAGYFNQKTKKIKIFTEYFLTLDGTTPNRDELLAIWGVGPETCDSILLYAYQVPVFVIDTYTKRIFTHLGLINDTDYEKIRKLFEKYLKRDSILYQEYHALLVQHAKCYYSKKPHGLNCPLLKHTQPHQD